MSETHDLINGYAPGEDIGVADDAARENVAADSAESTFSDVSGSSEAAAMTLPDPDEEEPPLFDALGSVSRLIAGLAIEGSLELLSILQEGGKKTRQGNESLNLMKNSVRPK